MKIIIGSVWEWPPFNSLQLGAHFYLGCIGFLRNDVKCFRTLGYACNIPGVKELKEYSTQLILFVEGPSQY